MNASAIDLLCFVGGRRFATVLSDPPWKFTNKTGKVAPEHKRLARYRPLSLDEILSLPAGQVTQEKAHLYLWCPNALLPEGLAVRKASASQHFTKDESERRRSAARPTNWARRYCGPLPCFQKAPPITSALVG